MIKTYIFDFNGTMIFDAELQKQAWQQVLKRAFHHQLTEAEFQAHVAGRNNQHTFSYFASTPLNAAEITQLSMEKEALYRQICLTRPDKFRLVPGLSNFLTNCIAVNHQVNIATASEAGNVDFFFEQLGLARWFDRDCVVVNDGQLPGKPAPDMFLAAIKQVGGQAATAVVFEDSPSGLLAANRAGVAATIQVVDPAENTPAVDSTITVTQVIQNYREL
ncbi:HAD family hydrolase [Levilactobacillus angrenensis]|uniref:HAD family hydrolase n=1 Tax=Levilactobacillus angrenensis TaxID=2486020 RepID=A0ABW1UCN9_9LACO|nr:HAD family phosphatase [Levilactobacillus angrenensis]